MLEDPERSFAVGEDLQAWKLRVSWNIEMVIDSAWKSGGQYREEKYRNWTMPSKKLIDQGRNHRENCKIQTKMQTKYQNL